jgi:hypothetical protein
MRSSQHSGEREKKKITHKEINWTKVGWINVNKRMRRCTVAVIA